ncbi:MAG: hypothetical protein KF760_07375 [Candidatus Eremiobacteraeota bacterium]|nr:hypothetical protein [Candidatus Eremiobacteraeota bacterium]MCW5870828.1 hypothetical protein [Candidatus Eremiobacteraeota bacterium]
MRAWVVSAGVLTVGLAAPLELPDVIVTHLSRTDKTVTVHLQNQGPGSGKGSVRLLVARQGAREGPVQVNVPAPKRVFEVTSSPPIPLRSLGVPADWSSQMLQVEIQADGQARSSNKTFYEQLERSSGVMHNDSGPYNEEHPDLPDLVIERVFYDGPSYLKVVYANRGRGRTGADFLISSRCGQRKFGGNYYYRYRVPPAGQSRTTGGLSIGRLGLKPGDKAQLEMTIDPEGRVRETNSQNNTWTGLVELR